MSYLIRRVLAKPRLILDEMCRLYGKFASYLRGLLCKTRLIFPRINAVSNGGCSHKCVNTLGGYKCECPDPELSLSSDNKTCNGKYKRIAAV